ncbi:bzip transcription factor [Diplodia corticola]|uniref:Bzip transcription factor n=1 Tax=Diplodia corticola TaxID=236234 RepID=A0A1J9S1F1_9PEZI|nr:bzip transcription factor [Diplodia corticola]OJD34415.1 bzip transcription factor [Diplodia corticola]
MGDSAQPSHDHVRPPKRQKSMTVIACNSCKRRKSKCNGARPACDRCLRLNEECHYELDSTISRQDGLKRRLREVTAKSDTLDALVSQLRSASDAEAADLIRQLRHGADAHELVDRSAAPSGSRLSSRLSSVAEEDNHQSYPSPPTEDSASKLPLASVTGADWKHAALSRTSDSQDDDKEQSIGSTRSSTPWGDSASPLPSGVQQTSALNESDLPPLIPRHKRRRLGPLTVSRGYVEAFGNMSTSSSIMAGHYPAEIQKHQVSNFQIPVYFLQPCWELDDAPFSRVVQDYRNLARMHYASKPMPELSRIDVTYFFVDRAFSPGSVPSISTWASEMNKSFEDVDVFWMINPTAETYAKMPDLIKPTPMQMMVPHISPLDTVPLPALREALVDDLRDWVTACAGSLSVNWPHGMDQAVEHDPTDDHFYLTQKFLDHASTPSNWSVGRDFIDQFPELMGRVMTSENPRSPEKYISPFGEDLSKKPASPGSLRASVPLSLRNAGKHKLK